MISGDYQFKNSYGYQLHCPMQPPLSHLLLLLHTPRLTTWSMFDRGISELKLSQGPRLDFISGFLLEFFFPGLYFFGCREKLIVCGFAAYICVKLRCFVLVYIG